MALSSSRCAAVRLRSALIHIAFCVILTIENVAAFSNSTTVTVNSCQCRLEPLRRLPISKFVKAVSRRRSNNHVWMSKQQQALIESFLEPNFTMLEYGSGFSTMWYSQFVNRYYSIEHNSTWGGVVASMSANNTKISYHIVDARPHTPGFWSYITKPEDFGVPRFDAVLIDGRNRVDCAMFVLKYIDHKSVVFLHDYFERPRYYPVEKYYDIVAAIKQGQSLVVLRKKKKHPPPPRIPAREAAGLSAGISLSVVAGKTA